MDVYSIIQKKTAKNQGFIFLFPLYSRFKGTRNLFKKKYFI